MAILSFFTATILLASITTAAPVEGTSVPYPDRPFPNLPQNDAEERAWKRTVGVAGVVLTTRASCEGQSCAIADLSGSTGKTPKIKPVGGDKNGYKCIAKYNPGGIEAVLKAPEGPPQNVGVSGAITSAIASGSSALSFVPARDTGKFTGKCNKNILFFARGTTETGTLGITVGPVLNAGLGYDWTVQGVPYDADFAGDNCLGLPGGHVARDLLNQAAEKCPDAKIFMAGYSEGGMVSHNGVAYATPEARKHVAAVVTFGDPFQGAKIKGYTGPILTFCNKGDPVCTGNFVVNTAHLAYTGSVAAQALKEMKKIAAGGSVDN